MFHAAAAEMASPSAAVAILYAMLDLRPFSAKETDGEDHSPGRAAYKCDFCLKRNQWQKKKGRWWWKLKNRMYKYVKNENDIQVSTKDGEEREIDII